LGDIRVLSSRASPAGRNPGVSADPSELENLRVALASPVTFERVGLQRPTGLVSELQFELTRNAQGRAVVRVTSQAPVETPSLSFLIEADWGQGRLVREYSALVDAPSSALAVAEPEIVAPAGTLSNTIAREPPRHLPPRARERARRPPPPRRHPHRLARVQWLHPLPHRQPMAASPSSVGRPCRRSPARWPAATRSAVTAR
jgi:pilus assembly protein FimV